MAIEHDLLSYRAAGQAQGRLEVAPAPVLELAYSTFFLSSRSCEAASDLAWVRELHEGDSDRLEALREELRALSSGGCRAGFELLVGACQLGYARDPDPVRFLTELPRLPERLLAQLESSPSPTDTAKLREQLKSLRDPEAVRRYEAALSGLWGLLAPLWKQDGEATVRRECRRLESSLGESGVLGALPKHHFARFEHGAAEISRHLGEGALVVTPLYFAAGGGFLFDVGPTLYLGYGLHSDASYARLQDRVQRAAAKAKGLADPTRLMILALVSKFELTVGDLAQQLEVSQPTVSGHLKLLREEGLVTLHKEGNKAYYRVARKETAALLEELEGLLLPAGKS